MGELSITVILEGQRDATYRFDESPVLIGRSPDAHLSICHEAVARELGYAWIEDDGRTVRLEERPGLTNEIVCGKNIVKGGVSGRRLDVSVGPVGLKLEPAFLSRSKDMMKRPLRRVVAILAFCLLVFLMMLVVFTSRKNVAENSASSQLLPGTPFCSKEATDCVSKSACLEKARLYETRARELFSRPQKMPREQVRAANMLVDAAMIYQEHQISGWAGIRADADSEIHRITVLYRREKMALSRELRLGETPSSAAVTGAGQLLEYLAGCEGSWKPWLKSIHLLQEKGKNK